MHEMLPKAQATRWQRAASFAYYEARRLMEDAETLAAQGYKVRAKNKRDKAIGFQRLGAEAFEQSRQYREMIWY